MACMCRPHEAVNITPHTPTANAIIEATHKVIGQTIHTLTNLKPLPDKASTKLLVDKALATTMHALRCSPVSSLGNFLPGALVFNQDMLLNIPLVADILTIAKHCQALIDKQSLCANCSRTCHEFKINQHAFVKNKAQDNELDLVTSRTSPNH